MLAWTQECGGRLTPLLLVGKPFDHHEGNEDARKDQVGHGHALASYVGAEKEDIGRCCYEEEQDLRRQLGMGGDKDMLTLWMVEMKVTLKRKKITGCTWLLITSQR